MPASISNSMCAWCLLDLSEDAAESKTDLPITGSFLIGRLVKSDLQLECGSVSGSHAEISMKKGQLWINDLDSTNGTFVNGVRIEESTQLHTDDILQIGSMAYQIGTNKPAQMKLRSVVETIESDIPESPEGRFHRLLRVGAVPFFQPVFDISDDQSKLVGYEILGRGRLPGLCTADEMFDAAKAMDKEEELSQTLRKRGIEAADANFSSGKMVFVNTHPFELNSENLAESLAKIRSIYPDRAFILELPVSILESTEMISVVDAATRDMGIDLAICGFNATSIRLEDLQRLSPKVVKFSAELIRDIHKADHRKHKLLSTMVEMLTKLDIQPMAEFVEQSGEHETLKQLGFGLAQGFYYGHPVSVEECHEEKKTTQKPESPAEKKPSPRPMRDRRTPQLQSPKTNIPASTAKVQCEITPGAKWILEQPENYFTIQVMVTITDNLASQYVAEQQQPDQYKVHQILCRGRRLFVVVYGSFVSREAAKVAGEELGDAASYRLVRQFSKVQSAIRSPGDFSLGGEDSV